MYPGLRGKNVYTDLQKFHSFTEYHQLMNFKNLLQMPETEGGEYVHSPNDGKNL